MGAVVRLVDPIQGWVLCAGNAAAADSKQVHATADGGTIWTAVAAALRLGRSGAYRGSTRRPGADAGRSV